MTHDDEQLNKNDALAQAISGIPDLESPADLTDRIMAQVNADEEVLAPSSESRYGSVAWGTFKSFVPLAAAVVLLVIVVPFVLTNQGTMESSNSQGSQAVSGGVMATGNPNNNTDVKAVPENGKLPDTLKEPVLVSSVDYVAEKELDAFFETWDEELVSAQEEGFNVSDDSFGDDYEALLYEDPLSTLVGF